MKEIFWGQLSKDINIKIAHSAVYKQIYSDPTPENWAAAAAVKCLTKVHAKK